jgi:hypothetical protein
MNWLNKLARQADQLVNAMDESLQQPITDALVFKPLHAEDTHSTNGIQVEISEDSQPCTPPPTGEVKRHVPSGRIAAAKSQYA